MKLKISAMGVLSGWRREHTENCLLLTAKVIDLPEASRGENEPTSKVVLAISESDVASLAREFSRAAVERGVVVWPNGVPDNLGPKRSVVDRMFDRITGREAPMYRFNGSRQGPAALLPDLSQQLAEGMGIQ